MPAVVELRSQFAVYLLPTDSAGPGALSTTGPLKRRQTQAGHVYSTKDLSYSVGEVRGHAAEGSCHTERQISQIQRSR